ncbi:PD-(D/E)XK nuclease family protein [Marinirhabdus gelatinilytica]|uniref:PD-(D/E)XK nuclease superfamily protein n=1 Tax=Marinirhabdus gelatinilytica TaxID=1703343 RepID=A0A370QJ96_9FLAO|nr:PD-(D/E)XK nuclease family protein [Marinirhabdus gelatinilytica]RDK88415.1 PD-(D/E)XK nuclease superfamily protein [Marinirhabdus gelatinilytica]
MQTFLEETLQLIEQKQENLSSCIFILPSKRAGGFLKNHLRKQTQKTTFLPKIISIEELIEELSGLEIIDTTELLFKSYEVYKNTKAIAEKESFEGYASWAITLMNDINEVDRYLLDPKQFFGYLGSIKSLERWNVTSERSSFIKNYLDFWKQLPEFYFNLKETLLKEDIAHQGLVYREAAENTEYYLQANGERKHVFIGFNALNTAEQQIIQAFLEIEHNSIYWDAENHFVDNTKHGASLFFRRYLKEWKMYKDNTPRLISNNFDQPKDITSIACSKNSAQIKYAGQLLEQYSQEKLNSTAIVLADETLLLPLLHSLPNNVTQVNVTMGAALKNFPIAVFFETWLAIHKKGSDTFYFRDTLKLLGSPVASQLLNSQQVTQAITQQNRSHYTLAQLQDISAEKDSTNLQLLFGNIETSPQRALEILGKIIFELQTTTTNNVVEKVVLHKLFGIMEQLLALGKKYDHISNLSTLIELFNELIASTTIDFKGEAFQGLQIMGVLETRVLDFENVIVLSVNEGVLPSGKSNASFITYDLKKQFNLPSYIEKDAIYTYHFYHMLHRAKEITLLYTNFSEGLNSGEKSRFILQLEIEGHPNHTYIEKVVTPNISIQQKEVTKIEKTEKVTQRLVTIATKGFSPSALTSYIRNPIDFYYQRILKVTEFNEVEETVAFNTLGTIVHDTLEQLYSPLVNYPLTKEVLENLQEKIAGEVTQQFSINFQGGDISKGKNLIIFEVAKRYVENLIAQDLTEIENGNTIEIVHIESDLTHTIDIPELSHPVNIHGKVDRVDLYNGQLRIIDYKTGNVQQADLDLVNWEELPIDYKYSKAFQVLTYALMLYGNQPFDVAQAGIISFKNMANGFLKFGTKDSPRSRNKNQEITRETLELFSEELKKLILEICSPEIPFTEKEV